MTHPSLLAPWGVNDINELLKPEPLRLEMGLSRSADGLLTVAVRTDLHGCKGRMLDWWFTFFENTQHINWWHPHDHVEHRGWDRHWKRGKLRRRQYRSGRVAGGAAAGRGAPQVSRRRGLLRPAAAAPGARRAGALRRRLRTHRLR